MSDTVQNGKGSKRRPARVSDDEVAANWRQVFGRVSPRESAVITEKPVVILAINYRIAKAYAEKQGLTNWRVPTMAEDLLGLRLDRINLIKLDGWEWRGPEFRLAVMRLEEQQ